MADREGTRKTGRAIVVCQSPDVCKTPMGNSTPAVPYQITATFCDSQSTSANVRFGGKPVFMLDQSTISKVTGDEAGTAGGVVSGTNEGTVEPIEASTTVRVNGKYVVRHGDTCKMNNGNTTGKVIYQPGSAPGCNIGPDGMPDKDTDPPITPETPEEKSFLEKLGDWWQKTKEEAGQAADQPLEGAKGAAKDTANLVPETGELLVKGDMLNQASEIEQTAYLHKLLGMHKSGDRMLETAAQMRRAADEVSLPKFEMSNPAQEGGAKIAMAAQLLSGLGALLKGGLKGTTKLAAKAGRKPTGLIDDAARQGSAVAKEGQTAVKGKDGVKISKRKMTTAEKGLFGEKRAHEHMQSKGFKKISKDPARPNSPGIDGVYQNPKPPPDYVIVEAKYGQSKLGKTLDGKQMSDDWVLGGDRLEKAVGLEKTKDILRAMDQGRTEKWLLRVDESGNVTQKALDSLGNIIRGK